MAELIDTHAHLQDFIAAGELEGVLARSAQAEVVQVIGIGVNAEESEQVVAIADENAGVFAAVGFQPNHLLELKDGDWERIVALAGAKTTVAIGETGLDRYWKTVPFELQQHWFDKHLELAEERDLPVVIHCRECERDIVEQLARRGRQVRGVLHSFTGGWDDAQAFMDLGLLISFAGMVTFKNKKLDPLRDVAARVPIDRILVETDSPYLSPEPFRGKRNEPARVVHTAAQVAEVRGCSIEEIARATTENARRLFRLPAKPTLS